MLPIVTKFTELRFVFRYVMLPLTLLVAGFREDLKALFVMNFLIIVLKELCVLCAINRNYSLE